jgi:D-3-phosphoglycerate dehydrogenase
VDESALADALRDGIILGAASDVFIEEPPPASHPLLRNDNFIATPHVGGATAEALERVGYEVASKVLSVVLDEGFSRQPLSR